MPEYHAPEYRAEEIRDFRVPPGIGKKIVVVGALIAVLIVLAGTVGTVGAGQRGVLLRFGAVTGAVKDEGLYFKIPFAEQVALMSTQIQKYSAPASSSSKDLQVVATEVTLNYQLDASRVGETYRNMRQDYESRVIQPFIQEAVKSTTANFDAEQLITRRPQV
ncbi:MAG: prohibitin family protein, partial [Acidobacteria bacterium]|nr:prohibitin family protein [Acidobacteriota bacterium]